MARIFSACSRCVFRSFRRFERFTDRLTGRAGPVFVTLACILIAGCAVTFFEVVYSYQFLTPNTSWFSFILGTLWSIYCVAMFTFHYYKAISVRPGSPRDPPPSLHAPALSRAWLDLVPAALCVGPLKERRRKAVEEEKRKSRVVSGVLAARQRAEMERSKELERAGKVNGGAKARPLGQKGEARANRYSRVCKKCDPGSLGAPEKPERTHHCSVCRTCVLKFDHHCPWINQCVGLHNERYFLLFLCYFSISCGFVAYWGFVPFLRCITFRNEWNHYTPRSCTLLLWILTVTFAFAIGVMAAFQLWLVALGETAVESSDNKWYSKTAKAHGRVFRNPYHLGWRRNMAYFFNVEPGGYHWSTIFLPVSVPPASDGWTWKKADGWEEFAMDGAEELTDEEEMSDGEE